MQARQRPCFSHLPGLALQFGPDLTMHPALSLQQVSQRFQPFKAAHGREGGLPDGLEAFSNAGIPVRRLRIRLPQQPGKGRRIPQEDIVHRLPVAFQHGALLLELFTPEEIQPELEFAPGVVFRLFTRVRRAFQEMDEAVREDAAADGRSSVRRLF